MSSDMRVPNISMVLFNLITRAKLAATKDEILRLQAELEGLSDSDVADDVDRILTRVVITPLAEAVKCFRERQLGSTIRVEPSGSRQKLTFPTKWGHRMVQIWVPDDSEKCSCCDSLHISPRFPNALYKHCLTVVHIACKFGVNKTELSKQLRKEGLLKPIQPRAARKPSIKMKHGEDIMPSINNVLKKLEEEMS